MPTAPLWVCDRPPDCSPACQTLQASASSEPPLADPKHSASTKLRRVQQRNDQLRRLFSLPATEVRALAVLVGKALAFV